jgi:hypothetical protein
MSIKEAGVEVERGPPQPTLYQRARADAHKRQPEPPQPATLGLPFSLAMERDGESAPMLPSRLRLAEHAKAGYKCNFGLSLFIMTLFNTMAILVSSLNWNTSCGFVSTELHWVGGLPTVTFGEFTDYPLGFVLFVYGVLGLVFVLVLLRHYCNFSELGAWPSKRTATLCLLLIIMIFAVGVTLIVFTILTQDTCRLTSPILWRWCFAIVLWFVMIVGLGLAIPSLRCFCGCVVAPIAYACVGCAETVHVCRSCTASPVPVLPCPTAPSTHHLAAAPRHFSTQPRTSSCRRSKRL